VVGAPSFSEVSMIESFVECSLRVLAIQVESMFEDRVFSHVLSSVVQGCFAS